MTRNHDNLLDILKGWLPSNELLELQVNVVAGGLSGAQLWRVSCGEHSYCLRRWPTVHPSEKGLQDIHSLIVHVWQGGLKVVPCPRFTRASQSFVKIAGHLWELSHWLAGGKQECFTEAQIEAAFESLARFHQSAAIYAIYPSGSAPGLMKRLSVLNELRDGALSQIEAATQLAPRTQLRLSAEVLIADIRRTLPMAMECVEHASTASYPLQWCLRDIHKGNLLFVDSQVSGLVDFGAASIDSVAGDVARLAGSIAGDNPQIWQHCLAAYTQNHPLSKVELQAVAAFDVGGLLVASANWLRWLFVEHREFPDEAAIQQRLAKLSKRLHCLAERGNPPLFSRSAPIET